MHSDFVSDQSGQVWVLIEAKPLMMNVNEDQI